MTLTDGDLLSLARGGDGAAFHALTGRYRRELLVHCYRMLGSIHDAEDVLQDALFAAWRGLGGFEERASLRTWLYRITTNRCLNARRALARRPPAPWDVPGVAPPPPTRLGEVPWLEPLPDVWLAGLPDAPPGPEARYEQRESVSLAFVTALQLLPPRQLAVLVLRDVLGFPAADVAGMVGASVDSVKSALARARATLRHRSGAPPAPGSRAETELVERFVRAWESADVRALVALLTDDVVASMPPMPFEYAGRGAVAGFCSALFDAGRRFDLVPTRANGQPAFGAYLRTGGRPGVGLYVLTPDGGRIAAMTRFPADLLGAFGLPPSQPDDHAVSVRSIRPDAC